MNIVKIIRINEVKNYLWIFISSLMFLTSCGKYENLNQNAEKLSGEEIFKSIFFGTKNSKIKIDHLSKFDNIRESLTNEELNKLDKFADLLIAKISNNNIDFFNSFQANIYSKDHYKIQEALNASNIAIQKSMLEIPEIREAYLLTSEIANDIDVSQFIDSKGDFDKKSFMKAVDNKYGENNPFIKTKKKSSLVSLKAYAESNGGADENEALVGPTVIGVWLAVAVVQTVAVAISYYVGVFVAKYTPWDKVRKEFVVESELQQDILVNDIYENL